VDFSVDLPGNYKGINVLSFHVKSELLVPNKIAFIDSPFILHQGLNDISIVHVLSD
jgi:hypothetical protein